MTMYDLLVTFVGTPANDMQALGLYYTACAMYVLLVFSVVYIMKSVISYFRKE